MEYTSERIGEQNFDDFIAIYQNVFQADVDPQSAGGKFDTDFTGLSNVGFIAYDEHHFPIAYYGVFPLQVKIDGKILLAAQSGDTMTHKSHLGKGLFTKLARETYQLCRQSGVHGVVGFPSASSYGGFTKKLDWVHNETIKKYEFYIPTLPLSELALRFKPLRGIEKAWRNLILKFYNVGQPFDGSVLSAGHPGIYRDNSFWQYKMKNPALKILKMGGVNVVVKFIGKLGVGDIDFSSTADFQKALSVLKWFCFLAGINRLSFYVSPGTRLDEELAKVKMPTEGLAIGYLNMNADVDLGRLKYTYFDFDTF